MPTYRQALREGEKMAHANHMESSAAKVLLLHHSEMENAALYLHLDDVMSEAQYAGFLEGCHRHFERKEPVQYVVGYTYFYGYKFHVDERVLIPRFETEELVANVLFHYDEMFDGKDVALVDVGTGSGCLAVALALEESHLHVSASDISEAALAVAKQNAAYLNSPVTFTQGDMLQPFEGKKFDILVSNPPYIPDEEFVEEIIKNHEPHTALFGGSDGLKFYEIILSGAKDILNEENFLAFEHAYNTKDALKELALRYFPEAEIVQYQDMQGKDRMTFVINRRKS
ncbi:MAG: peptide chain release factor N(5)-glutamine methyltransferase [Candidatus Izemoplasmatales bacterium]|nr:peptide chain release factor N(5)-glutamine methyltransferase [Candidatus Izemoplasmatales bacterium]